MRNGPRETVLIVDDRPTNIKVLFDSLKKCQYKASVAKKWGECH